MLMGAVILLEASPPRLPGAASALELLGACLPWRRPPGSAPCPGGAGLCSPRILCSASLGPGAPSLGLGEGGEPSADQPGSWDTCAQLPAPVPSPAPRGGLRNSRVPGTAAEGRSLPGRPPCPWSLPGLPGCGAHGWPSPTTPRPSIALVKGHATSPGAV